MIGLALFVCLLAGFYSQPRSDDGSVFDTSANAILEPAFEVYDWFYSSPLAHDETPYSDLLPYFRVTDERIADMDELTSAVENIFSPEISEKLFASDRYLEIDGQLYVDCGFATPRAVAAASESPSIAREMIGIISESCVIKYFKS